MYNRGQSQPSFAPTNNRQSSVGIRQTAHQEWDDADWDDSGGRPQPFDSRPASNRHVKNQGWDRERGAGSSAGRGQAKNWDDDDWEDGSSNANKTSPLRRPQNQENRDLRNKISGNSGDLRNKISGNSRERDLRNRIGGNDTSELRWDNTSKNRNDGSQQWGGNKDGRVQKGEWDDADWDNDDSNDAKTIEGEYFPLKHSFYLLISLFKISSDFL